MRGGVITGGLAKTVVVLVVVALVVFDGGAILVNSIQLDDIASGAMRTARQTYAESGRLDAVETAVAAKLAGEQGVELDGVEVADGELVLTMSRPSRTIVAHRIGPLQRHVERTVTKRAELP